MTTEDLNLPTPGAPAAPVVPPATPPAAPDPLTIEAPAEPVVPVVEATPEFTYAPSGDAGLDLALDYVGKLGFGPTTDAIKAAEAGDFSQLEAALKAMGDKAKGWEKILAVGKAGFAALDTQSKEHAAKAIERVHSAVGGPEQWKEVQAWAGQNASPDEKAAVNAALRAGGFVAEAVAKALAAKYMAQPTTSRQGRAAVVPGAANGSVGSDALSPRAYTDAVTKLRAELHGNLDGNPKYLALQARRRAWRG